MSRIRVLPVVSVALAAAVLGATALSVGAVAAPGTSVAPTDPGEVVVSISDAASATPSPTPTSTAAAAADAAAIGDLTTWIAAQPAAATSGFLSPVIRDDGSLALLWKGVDPFQQTALAEAARRGIPVTIEQRSMSLADNAVAQQAVVANAAPLAAAGFHLETIGGVGATPGFPVSGYVVPVTDAHAVATAASGERVALDAVASAVLSDPAGRAVLQAVLGRITGWPADTIVHVSAGGPNISASTGG